MVELRRQVMCSAQAVVRGEAGPQGGELVYDPVSNTTTTRESIRTLNSSAAPRDVATAALRYYFMAPDVAVMPAFNWELTYACTWHCRHCFQPTQHVGDSAAATVAAEDVEQVIRLVRDLGIPEVSLTGGEVLLVANLAEVVARLHAAVPGLSLRVLLSGRGLPQRAAAAGLLPALAAADACVRVPLYGPTAEIHEWVTRTRGSFADVVDFVSLARAAGVRVHVGVQVLHETFPYLAATLRLAQELNGTDVSLSAIIYPSSHGDGADHSLTADQLMHLLRHRSTAAVATDYVSGGCAQCRSGCRHPAIDPSGVLRSCDIAGDRVGRLSDGSAMLAQGLRAEQERLAADCDGCELSAACKRCPAFLRDGHCSADYRALVAAACAVVERRTATAQRLGWRCAEAGPSTALCGAHTGG